ncbi:MAG: hypothetical protein CMP69_04325 [Flavobacteriales bacterium]|nr:hypothetical protein [Flavobacteriales bacterium]
MLITQKNSKAIFIILIIVLFFSKKICSQEYISPIDYTIKLSGTFGELRNNHFHTGIDLKTGGIEGKKIYSIADGYVSRIKVSTWGYGKAIYITHKTGHTSVYAHLKNFSNKIEKKIKKYHYKKERFEINYYPEKNDLKVQQGEIIGFSGNSGSSGGPHIHFEIRDTKTSQPINPLLVGFDVKDNIAPKITKLKIYPINNANINGINKYNIYKTEKVQNNYFINEIPEISGEFGISISTYDMLNDAPNKNGIYKITVYVDSVINYKFEADKLDFKTNRYINAHIDYTERIVNNIKYHRCFKLKNNKLINYKKLVNKGIISFNDNKTHDINIEVADIKGNTSYLIFKVKSTNKKSELKNIEKSKKFIFYKPNMFKTKDFQIHMEKNSLYENINFIYSNEKNQYDFFGKIHKCHTEKIPVHKKFVLSIKENVPNRLRDKVYIAKKINKNYKYLGGEWKDGFLRTKVREFGDFCIVADTISPIIIAKNIFEGKNVKNQNNIIFKIKDNESGIKKYRGEINGKWVLMEYDFKNNSLIYNIDKIQLTEKNNIKVEVTDNIGNKTTKQIYFTF